MPDRLFPRWCGALFALLPLSEILYLPADAQSLYAAAAACAAAGLLAAGAARLSSAVAARPGVQLLLALAALFPLVCSLSRMSSFLRATVFTPNAPDALQRLAGEIALALTFVVRVQAALFVGTVQDILQHTGVQVTDTADTNDR